MAMQQVEYEFPDSDSKTTEVTVDVEEKEDNSLEIEEAVGREDMQVPTKELESEGIEIEIEDDTPLEDQGKVARSPADEVTDEELKDYSKSVKNRIKRLSKNIHDERRAKEEALRQSSALEEYTRQIMKENETLKQKSGQNHNALVQSAQKQVAAEIDNAKRIYKEAYESGDSDSIVEAQQALNTAQIRMEKVANIKPMDVEEKQKPLQPVENAVQSQNTEPKVTPQRDEKAKAWADENVWFGANKEMTSFAYGVHGTLVENGIDPRSDEYYEKINTRMREIFPDQFEEESGDTKKRTSNVVAPATRSTSPKKVTLKQSQVAIAKRLGIPLSEYAKQALELTRNK